MMKCHVISNSTENKAKQYEANRVDKAITMGAMCSCFYSKSNASIAIWNKLIRNHRTDIICSIPSSEPMHRAQLNEKFAAHCNTVYAAEITRQLDPDRTSGLSVEFECMLPPCC